MKYQHAKHDGRFLYPNSRGNDTTTKIDTTPGLQYDGIVDVEYLRDKMICCT